VIAYFDTSAVIPLLVAEPTSPDAVRLFESADRVVSVRLLYPEARAALAAAQRAGRLTTRQLRTAVRSLDGLLDEMDLVEVDETLGHRAGELAETEALRGYDAVHVAAAELVNDAELVFVTGDHAQAKAASAFASGVAELRS
jgi:predicted nucleic acid-binding protein